MAKRVGWGLVSASQWKRLGLALFGLFALCLAKDANADDPSYATYQSGNFGLQSAGAEVDSATGTARTSYPIVLPRARGRSQPILSLSYAHTAGFSEVGQGWSLGLPRIELRGLDGGRPRFDSPSTDIYELSGRPLVLLCTATSVNCSAASGTFRVPNWASGWKVYRPAVDPDYTRVYQHPGGSTWRLETRDGNILEFGQLTLADSSLVGPGIDHTSAENYSVRWNLVGQADPYVGASATNVVVYSWEQADPSTPGLTRLAEIFFTPPTSIATVNQYAHHVKLNYAPSWQRSHYPAPPWMRQQPATVASIDVASFGTAPSRQQVRRYHLQYTSILGRPHLTNVQLEGRCDTSFEETTVDGQGQQHYSLSSTTNCPIFGSGTTYTYQQEAQFNGGGWSGGDASVRKIRFQQKDAGGAISSATSPQFGPLAGALVDINRDGLADFVQTNGSNRWNAGAAAAPSVYINAGRQGFDRSVQLQQLNTGGYDQAFLMRYGISVFGGWGNAWQVSFAYRGFGVQSATGVTAETYPYIFTAGAASVTDGSPVALLDILPQNDGSWSLAQRAVTLPRLPPPHAYGDLNGDGTTDALYYSAGPPGATKIAFSKLTSDGVVHPFSDTGSTNLVLQTGESAPRYATLVDMDGDGVLDYLTQKDFSGLPESWVYIPGRGDGNFGCNTSPIDPLCQTATIAPGYNPAAPGSALLQARISGQYFDGTDWVDADPAHPITNLPGIPGDEPFQNLAFHDVTGDGKADAIWLYGVQPGLYSLAVWINVDGRSFRRDQDWVVPDPGSANISITPQKTLLTFGDLDGDGVDEVLLCGVAECVYRSYQAVHAGWLTGITNELGATTEIEYYESLAALELEQQSAGSTPTPWNPWPEDGPWRRHAPTSVAPVKRITVSSNNAAPYSRNVLTEYNYRDPVFDLRKKQLRGFGRVRVTQGGTRATDTRYLFGGCLADDANGRQFPCGFSISDFTESWAGIPFVVEQLNPTTDVYSSTTVNYVTPLADGSGVWFAYAGVIDTYLYDVESFAPSSSTIPYYVPGDQTPSISVAIRADAVRLRKSQLYDNVANLSSATDYGRITSSGDPIDRPIKTTYTYRTPTATSLPYLGTEYLLSEVVRGYDTGGTAPLVPGLDPPAPRDLTFSYNDYGHLTRVAARTIGVLQLQRSHPPANAAVDAGFTYLLSVVEDKFGNVVQSEGAVSGECTTQTFDPAYADTLSARYQWLGGSCTAGSNLASHYVYDRGTSALTAFQAPTSLSWQFTQDEFGRPKDSISVGIDGSSVHSNVSYSPTDSPNHWVHAISNVGDPETQSERWTYLDNFGRPTTVFEPADPAAGDGGYWVVRAAPRLSDIGEPIFDYEPWFSSAQPELYTIGAPDGAERTMTSYDFMSRPKEVYRFVDGIVLARRSYHPLSVESSDAENIQGAANHLGMSSRVQRDGHGRAISSAKLTENGTVTTSYDYLATGELCALERTDGAGARYRRWLRYDSAGHVVENAEPNSSSQFEDTPSPAGSMSAWRYAYDIDGRLVGTKDARGCGKNLTYDRLGRLLTVDFSPCEGNQAPYSAPQANGDGTEVLYQYDTPESGQTEDYGGDPRNLRGKLVSVRDRGAHTRYAYDARGRQTGVARRIAVPGMAPAALTSRYTNYWFRSTIEFDAADRPRAVATGADVPELMGSGGGVLDFHYSKRGSLYSVDGSYGALLQGQQFDANELPQAVSYGDALQTVASMSYNPDHSLFTYSLTQGAGAGSLVMANVLGYDLVGNVKSVADTRDPASLPDGAKPVSRSMSYDAMYRLTDVAYDHSGDLQISPFAPEEASSSGRPLPHVIEPTRINWQSFSYDGLGNLTASADDSAAVFDRSLGGLNLGSMGSAFGPHQLLSNTDESVSAHYDSSGNLVDLAIDRPGSCSGPLEKCAQRFTYDWDEVGQLSAARRYDYSTLVGQPSYPLAPSGLPAVELDYQYSDGNRVVRASTDSSSDPSYTVTPFEALRLDNAGYIDGEYERTRSTESVYLAGMAKVVYGEQLPNGGTHVLMTFGDHLGSSSATVDKDSGELVEYTTYQAYGATESDYRSAAWAGYRENRRFTGKDDDVEVGLLYFGARYYSPYLSRFISPDPLTVHGLGSDLNPYGYVGGRVFNATDPFGLESACPGCDDGDGGVSTGGSATSGTGSSGGGNHTYTGNNLSPYRGTPTSGGGGGGYNSWDARSYVQPWIAPGLGSLVTNGLGVQTVATSLNPADPRPVKLAMPGDIPDEVLDAHLHPGTAGQIGIGAYNTAVGMASSPFTAALLHEYLAIENTGPDSVELHFGSFLMMAGAAAFGNPFAEAGAASEAGALGSAAESGGGGAGAIGGGGGAAAGEAGATFIAGPGGIVVQTGLTPAELLIVNGRRIGEAGSSKAIRIMSGGETAANMMYEQLTAGGVSSNVAYGGARAANLPGGGWVGLRTFSTGSGARIAPSATIDVVIPGITNIEKLKFFP